MALPEEGKKLTIAIAAHGDMKTDTAINLATQVKTLQCPIRLEVVRSAYTHHNRNLLMQQAIDAGSTHLMFIDTDMRFPQDGVQRLMAHDKDVIGGSYNLRQPGDQVSTVKQLDRSASVLDLSRLQKVRAVGTGFMLIRLDAIRALNLSPDGHVNGEPLPPLWFYFDYDGEWVGEDVYFCDLVRKHGLDVWCDPTIPLGHIGEAVY